MTTLTEVSHDGEFILKEWDVNNSRVAGVLASGNNLEAGAVLGTVSGEYVEYDPGGSGGAEVVAGVLWGTVDATSADAACVAVVRGPITVNRLELHYEATVTDPQKVTAEAALDALGIIVVG